VLPHERNNVWEVFCEQAYSCLLTFRRVFRFEERLPSIHLSETYLGMTLPYASLSFGIKQQVDLNDFRYDGPSLSGQTLSIYFLPACFGLKIILASKHRTYGCGENAARTCFQNFTRGAVGQARAPVEQANRNIDNK
jgi:hypothetical protein